ncbi:BA14K family protein [Enterovirga sp. DB1703]|uniref:Lectin-like protein BA14k n=2 Tax=Enterovirga aerilata TaxID=2730920 RepID=A0A849IC43_9HYPH|nr:BA14K family protein [Enterovirga sp. DB1703]
MTTSLRKCLGAGALGAALLAGSLAAQAAEVPGDGLAQAARQAQTRTYPGESFTQGKIYYGRPGWRGGYRGGYYGRGYRGGYYRRGYGGGAVAAGVIGGLALGAIAAGAAANAAPPPAYPGAPVGNIYGADPNWVNYCASKYRSFDPTTGTYLARDGRRYPCQ